MTLIVKAFPYAFSGMGTVDISYLLYSFGPILVVVIIKANIIFNYVELMFTDTIQAGEYL